MSLARTACALAAAAEAAPTGRAVFAGRWWTWAELDRWAEAWRGWLEARGVGQGDRVAVLAQNQVALVPAIYGARRLGARVLLLNTRLTAAELAPLVAANPAKLVLVDSELRERLPSAEVFPRELPLDGVRGAAATGLRGDAPWLELLTSGTTGPPKPVALSAASFEAHARAHASNLGGSAAHRWYLCLPMFHVGALAMITRAVHQRGSLVIALGFDAARFLADAEAHQLTHASLVPTQLARVLEALGGRRFPAGFQALLIGGGPVPPGLMRRARQLGAPVLHTYGLTEACSQVCTERPADADGQSAGPPLEGLEVSILGPDGPAAPGTPGRIHVAGPTVASAFGGHLDTGDLGFFDERGRLHVLARRTDLIVSGGENVYPWEIERALLELPYVRDAAVGAQPDELWGQRVAAAVVVESGHDDSELTAALRDRLAGFKLPRLYLRVAELPRTPTGKVDRRALAALFDAARNGPAARA